MAIARDEPRHGSMRAPLNTRGCNKEKREKREKRKEKRACRICARRFEGCDIELELVHDMIHVQESLIRKKQQIQQLGVHILGILHDCFSVCGCARDFAKILYVFCRRWTRDSQHIAGQLQCWCQ
jgi:hypothetical protein